jgi:hypothetical protein
VTSGSCRGSRDVLLTAIAKARAWIADLAEGRAASFAEIAKREGKVERHIRLLAPLAFVSPQFVSEIFTKNVLDPMIGHKPYYGNRHGKLRGPIGQ